MHGGTDTSENNRFCLCKALPSPLRLSVKVICQAALHRHITNPGENLAKFLN